MTRFTKIALAATLAGLLLSATLISSSSAVTAGTGEKGSSCSYPFEVRYSRGKIVGDTKYIRVSKAYIGKADGTHIYFAWRPNRRNVVICETVIKQRKEKVWVSHNARGGRWHGVNDDPQKANGIEHMSVTGYLKSTRKAKPLVKRGANCRHPISSYQQGAEDAPKTPGVVLRYRRQEWEVSRKVVQHWSWRISRAYKPCSLFLHYRLSSRGKTLFRDVAIRGNTGKYQWTPSAHNNFPQEGYEIAALKVKCAKGYHSKKRGLAGGVLGTRWACRR